jgi:hypothetical protein
MRIPIAEDSMKVRHYSELDMLCAAQQGKWRAEILHIVIPAKAGTHAERALGLRLLAAPLDGLWIPASAGMTARLSQRVLSAGLDGYRIVANAHCR